MARPLKKGLDYFPFDVDFFSNKKIKRLRARYGSNGILMYMYLLCEIYKNGYYIKYDEDLILDISDDLNISENLTMQIMNYLFSRSLLDGKLAESVKVLTAESIQRRYQKAIVKRAENRDIPVEAEFWVLKKNETESYIKVYPIEVSGENNCSFRDKNSIKCEEKHIKESKVKESKVKESKTGTLAADEKTTKKSNSFSESFEDFWKAYPNRKAKTNALKAWNKLKPDDNLVRIILDALEKQKNSHQWQKDNGQFIPHPATWLNGRRWEDDMSVDVSTATADTGEHSYDLDVLKSFVNRI